MSLAWTMCAGRTFGRLQEGGSLDVSLIRGTAPRGVGDGASCAPLTPPRGEGSSRRAAPCWASRALSLDPLELAARARLARLLALPPARVTLHEASALEGRSEQSVQPLKRGGDAVTDGLGLAVDATATNGRCDAILTRRPRLEEGREHGVPLHPVPAKEARERLLVDPDGG